MNREEKAKIVDELNDKFGKSTFAVVADYQGLTVPVLQELRHELRRNDAEFRVAKNSLLNRGIKGTEHEGLEEFFAGTSAITFSYGDPVVPAKILTEFSKDHAQLQIRSAMLNGKLLTQEDIAALSKLPSKDILLGQMLSVLQAVPTGLVRVLSGVPRAFLYALQGIRDNKEQTEN